MSNRLVDLQLYSDHHQGHCVVRKSRAAMCQFDRNGRAVQARLAAFFSKVAANRVEFAAFSSKEEAYPKVVMSAEVDPSRVLLSTSQRFPCFQLLEASIGSLVSCWDNP